MPAGLFAVPAHGHHAPAPAPAGIEEEPAAVVSRAAADHPQVGGVEQRSGGTCQRKRGEVGTDLLGDHPTVAANENGGGRGLVRLGGNGLPGVVVVWIGARPVEGAAERQRTLERPFVSGVAEARRDRLVDEAGLPRPDDEVLVARQVFAWLGRIPARTGIAEVKYRVPANGERQHQAVDEALVASVRTNHLGGL